MTSNKKTGQRTRDDRPLIGFKKLPHPPPRVKQADDFLGYVMAMRNSDGLELMAANPHAFCLLYVIAMRARWSHAFNRYNLAPGEALIGDHKSYGLTRQQERTARALLKKLGFATIKPTNKGTVARLINTRVFDINAVEANHQTNQRPTSSQPAANQRPTTNKKVKKVKKEQKGKGEAPPSDASQGKNKELDAWKARVSRMYERELKQVEEDILTKKRTAKSEEAKAEWQERLKFVKAQRLGPPVAVPADMTATAKDSPMTTTAMTTTATATTATISVEEQIRELHAAVNAAEPPRRVRRTLKDA